MSIKHLTWNTSLTADRNRNQNRILLSQKTWDFLSDMYNGWCLCLCLILTRPFQVLVVTSAHRVTMETLVSRGGSVSPVSATTTLTCRTHSLVMLKPASVWTACTTVRVPPARTANWVTTAMLCCRTAGVSTLCLLGYRGSHIHCCDLRTLWSHWNRDQ